MSTDDPPEAAGTTLRVRVDTITAHDEATALLHCTDAAGTMFRLAVADDGTGSTIDWERGQWYRLTGIEPAAPTARAEARFSPATGECRPSSPPADAAADGSSDASTLPGLAPLGTFDDRLGVTVTVRPTTEAPRSATSDSFEITAVCLAAFDRPAKDTVVYHREEADQHDERLLLEHVVADLADADQGLLVGWSDSHSPFATLQARLAALADGDVLPAGAARALDGFHVADLSQLGARHGADDAVATARALGLDADYPQVQGDGLDRSPATWREDWDGGTPVTELSDPRMYRRDYLTLVDQYLTTTADEDADRAALGTRLKAYASADLPVLQALADHEAAQPVGCRRLPSGDGPDGPA
jgi:hypothetical protein